MTEEKTLAEQFYPDMKTTPVEEPERKVSIDDLYRSGDKTVEKAPEEKPIPEPKGESKEVSQEEPEAVLEEYDLKLAKGSPISPQQVDNTVAFAKEQGLSSDQAQAILDRDQKAYSEFNQQVEQEKKGWIAQLQNDREIGGDAFRENVEYARRALSRFGSDDLKKSLDETGLGSHPELVRTFARIGRAMGEDKFINAVSHSNPPKRPEDAFYPNMKRSDQ